MFVDGWMDGMSRELVGAGGGGVVGHVCNFELHQSNGVGLSGEGTGDEWPKCPACRLLDR